MVVSLFKGIAQVPLFDSGVIYSSIINFARSSYGPVILSDPKSSNSDTSQLVYVNAELICVGGVASIQLGSASNPGGNLNPMNFYDDAFQQVADISGRSGSAYFFRKFCLPQPGDYDGSNQWNLQTDTTDAEDKGYYTDLFPAQYLGQPASAAAYATVKGTSLITVRRSNSIIQGPTYYATDGDALPGPGLWNVDVNFGAPTTGCTWTGNRIQFGSANPSTIVSGFDNCFVQFGGIATPPKVFWLDSLNPSTNQSEQTWQIDNPILDAIFQGRNTNWYLWDKGFIVCLATGGTGPTGQLNEVLVFNTDCTEYYLIQFVPQDADSYQQVNSGSGYNVAIDVNGIVWMNNGYVVGGNRVSSSYSPTGFTVPVIQVPPMNPIILPCYNTCSPVSLIDNQES